MWFCFPFRIYFPDIYRFQLWVKIIIRNDDKGEICSTLEGQVVAIADEIAQRGHDVDDALTSGVMTVDEFIDRLKISKCKKLGINLL